MLTKEQVQECYQIIKALRWEMEDGGGRFSANLYVDSGRLLDGLLADLAQEGIGEPFDYFLQRRRATTQAT